MEDKLKSTSFADLAIALADDYECIYVIDSKDDSYVEYTTEGTDNELSIRSSGEDFYADTVVNCKRLVWVEDQSKFLRTFRKDKVIDSLANGSFFELRYRLNINDKPVHYYLKTIRNKGEDIIIGVKNVDAQVRSDMENREKYMIYDDIARSLGSMFEAIYYIDINDGHYIEFYSSQSYSDLGIDDGGDNFFDKVKTDIEKHIYKDDREMLMRELDKDNLLSILKVSNEHSMTYRQFIDGKLQYLNLSVFRMQNESDHIVIGVRNIDSQKKHEDYITNEKETFGEIAVALAQRYDIIYQVNIKTNEYSEYCVNDEYAKLEVGAKGEDFFTETQNNLKTDIHPDDYPMMAAAMQKDYFLENLKATGKLVLSYRLLINNKPQHVALFAVRPKEDSDHVIIAVANVDSTKKMDEKFTQAMDDAMNMAETDPLTGFKNKQSFAQLEMKLDNQISEKEEITFSIMVCDVNGMKQINNTQGHKAGDEYIKSAGQLIKEVFEDCDIYRVGGDEFAIFIDGDNYNQRHSLYRRMTELNLARKLSGEATVAFGLADYDPENDIIVQDVYEKSLKAMMVNKRSLKGRDTAVVSEKDEVNLNLSSDEQTLNFYELFIRLVDVMTDPKYKNSPNTPVIEQLLIDISNMFRLSKAVTRLFRNPQEEAAGGGETLCCFDTGIEGDEILNIRVVSSVMSITQMSVYMAPDEKPLTEEERWRVELVMRTVISYVGRNRITSLLEELTYYDDNGFLNQRSYLRYLMKNKKTINGMFAVRYNLLHFSLVNHELGRKTADVVMRNHYEGLKRIIGDNGILCRLGGDNFVGIFAYEQLGHVLTYLNDVPVIYNTSQGKTVNISTSIGIYRVPVDEEVKDPGDIMEKINIAYQKAKSGGRERIVFFNDSFSNARDDEMRVQRLFPEALKNEEFQVYYQPKVHTMTGEIIGAEALCRWFHDGAMISPGSFIPMLEETDDICRLDFYMLEHVCRDIRRWLDEGRKVVRVSVNLSRKNMTNTKLVDNLLKIIDRHNIPHSCIEIELTETTADVGFNDLKRVVNGLQSVGIFTSVDDFGMGYSSLNLIRELPWNVIKVDRSFLPVEEDEPDSVNSIMFKYVIAMANELGIECIVEGVETAKQLEILRTNKCSFAQGFLFDRPLPVRDFEDRMNTEEYSLDV